jgi:hypothetical protein
MKGVAISADSRLSLERGMGAATQQGAFLAPLIITVVNLRLVSPAVR